MSKNDDLKRLDSEYLAMEISGETWHVEFDALRSIPRVGESIRLTGGKSGKVVDVEYEFSPQGAPNRLGEEMPTDQSYARPTRIVVRVSLLSGDSREGLA
jgi:hypothetical protein